MNHLFGAQLHIMNIIYVLVKYFKFQIQELPLMVSRIHLPLIGSASACFPMLTVHLPLNLFGAALVSIASVPFFSFLLQLPLQSVHTLSLLTLYPLHLCFCTLVPTLVPLSLSPLLFSSRMCVTLCIFFPFHLPIFLHSPPSPGVLMFFLSAFFSLFFLSSVHFLSAPRSCSPLHRS